jgi:hypothetical protein
VLHARQDRSAAIKGRPSGRPASSAARPLASAALTLFPIDPERDKRASVGNMRVPGPSRANPGPPADWPLLLAGVSVPAEDHAATSSRSVRSSSPLPVLFTRLDTGHMRRRSSATGISSSAPPSPLSQRPHIRLIEHHRHAIMDRPSQLIRRNRRPRMPRTFRFNCAPCW